MNATYAFLVWLFPGIATWPPWAVAVLCATPPALACFGFASAGPVVYVYAERKLSAFMQDRLGPMRAGPYGVLQTIADTIKLLFKEAIFPRGVDRKLFVTAPLLVNVGAFLPFVVIPWGARLQPADLNVGVFYVSAISAVSTVGLIMAGWASNNKYALFGAMRSAAQIVSYEIPALLVILVPVMIVGSLSLQDLTLAQQGGLSNWFLFRYFPLMPVAFVLFFTAALAETNRAPFDIPEAESELVAGFHTEYSGFFFSLFFLAEYTEMFVVSAVASVLFLGGYLAPLPMMQTLACVSLPGVSLGGVWLLLKSLALVFVMMWLRWTLPRARVDQLMYIAWKVLLPIALALVVVVGGLVLWPPTAHGFPWDRFVGWPLTLALVAFLLVVMVRAMQWNRARDRRLALSAPQVSR
jgi:NADH-quinone oxidoreductase subunit H